MRPSAGLVSSRDVSFDCFNGAESFGVDIRVRNFDAAVFLQDVNEINQRETVEGTDLKQIIFGFRRRRAVGGRIVVEKSYCACGNDMSDSFFFLAFVLLLPGRG